LLMRLRSIPLFIHLCLAGLLGSLHPVLAHNGAVFLAMPAGEIEIDGDFSDWPEEISWNRLTGNRSGEPVEDEEDFQGRFAVAYSGAENALYVAIEARDQSLVLEAEMLRYDTVDGMELYVDGVHDREEVSVGQYNIWSDKPGGIGGNSREMKVEATRGDRVHRYEWRVDIDAKYGGEIQLQPGAVVGVDVAVWDLDEDGSKSFLTSGKTGGRFVSASLGDAILLGPGEELGKIEIGLEREDGRPIKGRLIEINSQRAADCWLRVRTDGKGKISAALPAGVYRLEVGSQREFSAEAEVEAGRTLDLGNRILSASDGKSSPAGPGRRSLAIGRRVRAGSGIRQGTWRLLGVADGLTDATVTDILQDLQGDLWFATAAGGVLHYDGEYMTAYTTADGLGSDVVSEFWQDARGILWIGTGGGLSRLDGEELITYTTADGLLDDDIRAVRGDSEGGIWIGTRAGLCRFDGEKFTVFKTADGLGDVRISALAPDSSGGLWIGAESGLSHFDGEYFEILDIFEVQELVRDFAVEPSGALWMALAPHGVGRFDGLNFTSYDVGEGLTDGNAFGIEIGRDGEIWVGVQGGVNRFDGKTWDALAPDGELTLQLVGALLQDRTGNLWIGSGVSILNAGIGVLRHTGGEYSSVSTEFPIFGLTEDSQGRLWLGTNEGAHYWEDGNLTALDSVKSYVFGILEDSRGHIWLGTHATGAYVYDNGQLTNYKMEDGLVDDFIYALYSDADGDVWLGGWGGVSRFDGERFYNFTAADGLLAGRIGGIAEDRQGNIWFGSNTENRGASRFDGREFTHYTTADGLVHNNVNDILEDRQGDLWFGTSAGVSRFDGEEFVNFTTADGLGHNHILDIMEDRRGHLWFSTFGGGVSRYDGKVFQSLLQRDGLLHDGVQHAVQAENGDYWIGTEAGFTCFRPRLTPPGIRLSRIFADREYPLMERVEISTEQDYLAFEFRGSSLKTRPNQMAYVYRLKGFDADWQVTRERQVIYRDLPLGEYEFEVQAVDRDLTYSEKPATALVRVHPPYGQIGLWVVLALALGGVATAGGAALRNRRERDRAREQLVCELEEELQMAHEMQMGLMPEEDPRVPGIDVIGRCLPANHVGGDFFQYFQREGKLIVCMADVTGHAMEAAIPVVMFSGILENQMEVEYPLAELFERLNRSLHRILDRRTFVCFTMGEIDLGTRVFRMANGGCPYPLHFLAASGEIAEVQVDAYPLGVRSETVFPVTEVQLAPGDRIVFCSDGIVEAEDEEGELFGFERTNEVIRQGCLEGLAAEQLTDRLLMEVREFVGEEAQGDDQTVVVVALQ
jgi:ligand-binding sensor domain-containing protein/serine phosphatase RsbU (regulator of sigma subunit)